jgi:hypothetical protein
MIEYFDMKGLLAGIVLIVVLGVAGLMYRNVLERRSPQVTACTLEAKVCPDGTSVGRAGPDCSFAPCAFPNIEFTSAHIAFALPAGYTKGVQEPGGDGEVPDMLDFYRKPSVSDFHTITVFSHPVPTGSTTDEVILAHTVLEPSEQPPKGISAYSPKIIGTRTFLEITTERFEGVVATSYFLPRKNDVLEFLVIEKDVDWTNPSLIPDNLPEHKALITMLGTLEDTSSQSE